MVLREVERGVVCIGQPAHAWVSGQLARAWGNDRFPAPDPRDEVCLAVGQHDLGMAAWDAAPTLNPETGFPHSFLEMPLDAHLRMWTEAPRLALSQSRWEALVVSMHGAALYGRRDLEREPPEAAAAIRSYLDGQRAFQSRLRASLGVSDEAAASVQRLVWAWDWMSLVLCMDRLPADVPAVPAAGGDQAALRMERGVIVDPWPFGADDVRLRVDGRHLPEPLPDEEALHAALDAAEWVALEFRLLPA